MGILPAVFLDRDGVLNKVHTGPDGCTHPPTCVKEVQLFEDAEKALSMLTRNGFTLVGVTNQPDVARGKQTEARVREINQYILARLPISEILTCFHDDSDRCSCRKPKPGMLLQAAEKYGIALRSSFMIGDRWTDIQAGQEVGCTSILISDRPLMIGNPINCLCAASLLGAARWVLSCPRRNEWGLPV